MKAVIYARYSSDNQREESIEGQIRECKEFAERSGYLVLNTYIDRALSAKTDNRPSFQEMIRDSSKGLFDVVLVWKLDRFARNRYDSAHYKHILKKNGVRVISATERITDTPEGILLESMLEGYAEFYSAELAEKVKRGMKENALKCKYNGSNVTFGYQIDEDRHYIIDPIKAPLVREIFEEYADGKTIKHIINMLNGKGIKNSKGSKFQTTGVSYLLSNRRYLGEYRYGDVVIPNAYEAIISEELFEKVQARLAKNKKSPAHYKAEVPYILSGKLFCGDCNMQMVADSCKKANGKMHRYYKCYNNKKTKTCKAKAVQKQWLEDLVIRATMELLANEKLLNKIANTIHKLQDKEPSNLKSLNKELAQIEKSIENILKAIEQGVLTTSTKNRLEELEQKQEEIKARIMQESLYKPRFTKEQIKIWLDKWRKTDVKSSIERQKLVDIFVNSVYNYKDKIIIIFNHKDGEKLIVLDEQTCSDLELTSQPVGIVL